MPQSSESFHETKEKLQRSVEDMRRSHLSSALERLSRRGAQKPNVPAVERRPSGPLDKGSQYLCIKGNFRTRSAGGVWGLFVLLADRTSGEIFFLSLWAGYGGLKNADLEASWQALSVLMEEEAQSQDKTLHEKILAALEDFFNPPMVNRLASDLENQDRIKKAKEGFLVDLGRNMSLNFEGAMSIDLTDGDEPQKYLDSRKTESEEKNDQQEEDKKSAEIQRISILCGVIMDPVRGRPVSSLRIGDPIYVSVREGSAVAHAIRQAMAKGGTDRIPAPIISILATSTGNVEILVELSEGIYGRLLAGESYKVAVPSDSNDEGRGGLPASPVVWFFFFAIVTLILALIVLTY